MSWKKICSKPWPVWLSWLECHPVTERLHIWIPLRAHTWAAGLICGLGTYDPRCRHVQEATNQCFSLTSMFLSLILSLKKQCPRVSIFLKIALRHQDIRNFIFRYSQTAKITRNFSRIRLGKRASVCPLTCLLTKSKWSSISCSWKFSSCPVQTLGP